MKRVYLDSSVIIRNPDVLSRRKTGVELLIPEVVYQELGGRSGRTSKVRELAEQAIQYGFAKLAPSPGTIHRSSFGPAKGVDTLLLLQVMADKSDGVVLASDDRDLIAAGPAAGVQIISSGQLDSLLSIPDDRSEVLRQRAREIRKRALVAVGVCAVVGTLASYFLSYSGPILNWVFFNFGIASAFLALPIGIGFYFFRSRSPFWYGAAEVVVGVAAVGASSRSLPNLSLDAESGPLLIGALGGLYIIVRGLDNMSKDADRTALAFLFRMIRGSN